MTQTTVYSRGPSKTYDDSKDVPKQFINKQMNNLQSGLNKVKAGVVDKVSDVLSYPARRAAQKSMINSDRNLAVLKNRSAADKANFKWSVDPSGELNAAPLAQQKAAAAGNSAPNIKPTYKIPKTPSNGIGVGGGSAQDYLQRNDPQSLRNFQKANPGKSFTNEDLQHYNATR